MGKALLCVCTTCKVKIAQGFLLYELGTIYNSVNDPSEICTMHLCCKFVFLQERKEHKASNVLTEGLPDCTKYVFGIVLAVFRNAVEFISCFCDPLSLQMTFISNYASTFKIFNENTCFQLPRGKYPLYKYCYAA